MTGTVPHLVDNPYVAKDYRDKIVLITGGTKGIGLACGLAFGRLGAHVWMTNRWGSADEDAIRDLFEKAGAPAPHIVEADASKKKETVALYEQIAKTHGDDAGIDVLIANVCVVMRGDGVDSYQERALKQSLAYSSWPFVDYLHKAHERFGRYPEYAIAMSSDGPDQHYPHYDYVAVAKAVLETFVRYMATHLRNEQTAGGVGVKVNALRTRQVVTESYREIFGEEMVTLAEKFSEFAMTAEEVADTTLALCSGLLDTLSGQVIMLDRGASFVDNVFTMGPRLTRG